MRRGIHGRSRADRRLRARRARRRRSARPSRSISRRASAAARSSRASGRSPARSHTRPTGRCRPRLCADGSSSRRAASGRTSCRCGVPLPRPRRCRPSPPSRRWRRSGSASGRRRLSSDLDGRESELAVLEHPDARTSRSDEREATSSSPRVETPPSSCGGLVPRPQGRTTRSGSSRTASRSGRDSSSSRAWRC